MKNKIVLFLSLFTAIFVVRVARQFNSYYSIAVSDKVTIIVGPNSSIEKAQQSWVDHAKKFNIKQSDWAWGNSRILEFRKQGFTE